ncbi:hypothetical protein LCGC14_2738230, partial [marine sediment metagenome]
MSKQFVQRYNPRYAHDIVQMKDGSFVTFEAYEAIDKQRDALLAACKDLINANVYARRVSLRDEAPRGSVWGEARSC